MARKDKVQKTNAMRELERAGVTYEAITFEEPDPMGKSDLGVQIAHMLGYDPLQGFKTLVLEGAGGVYVVCCIPSDAELDLKKAAAAAGLKSLSMLHVKDLEPLTGYVRGGCSPVGMKKQFPTLLDETCELFDEIYISGGRLGLTLKVGVEPLVGFLNATVADICR